MASDDGYKEVYFHEHCKTCKYEKTPEVADPCNDCLEYAFNYESNKPYFWKSKDE